LAVTSSLKPKKSYSKLLDWGVARGWGGKLKDIAWPRTVLLGFLMGGVLDLNFRRSTHNIFDEELKNTSALWKARWVITNGSNKPTLLLS